MKFVIENPQMNVASFFRRAGYHFQKHEGKKMAFARSLTGQKFPRYHAFARLNGLKIVINIHIDHKAASYEGTARHSGEYGKDSKLLKAEVERLMNLL